MAFDVNKERPPIPPEWEGLYEFFDTHESQGHIVSCQVISYQQEDICVLYFECESCDLKFWPSMWKILIRPSRTD